MSSDTGSPLLLYTGKTPNGYKASILLEELKLAYGGPDYELVFVSNARYSRSNY